MTITPPPPNIQIRQLPRTPFELYHFIRGIWGVAIPSVQVCPDHSTPFAAFAEAYFATTAISIWEASRGFGGKTMMLGTLGLMEACVLNAQVSILGGSGAQSLRVHEACKEGWASPHAPKYLLAKDPTRFMTNLTNGAWIETLMASQRSVRGTHPQRLRLDEVDEMEIEIFNASLGTQMMGKTGLQKGVQTHVVVSSTHQYPNGTFTEVKKRMVENGWSYHPWCFKECSNPVDGWLTQPEIERKKTEVPKAMWESEYELQEPSFEGRAFDTVAVEFCFDPAMGESDEDLWRNENYRPGIVRLADKSSTGHNLHVTGIDWAKEVDWTVIATFDTQWREHEDATDYTWRCVAWKGMRRIPWPAQVEQGERRYREYPGFLAHDATGLGNVIADYFDPALRRQNKSRIVDVVLTGGGGRGIPANAQGKMSVSRATIFTDYIAAIEGGLIRYPRLKRPYLEHKYCTMDQLFGKDHPPDSIVAGAVAWAMRAKIGQGLIPLPQSHSRQHNPWDLMTDWNRGAH